MIISIVTGGSRGDVQPYIAIGKGLQEAGFDIRIIASDDFETLITDAGLTFLSMGFSVQQIIQSDEWRATTENGNFLKILAKMKEATKRQAQSMAARLPDLLHDTDYILTGAAGYGGTFSIAEKLNIPVIQAHVFPLTPTRAFPSPLTPTLPFGKLLNPLSFHITRQMLWQSTRMGDVATRQILNLSKASFWGPFRKLEKMDVPTLYGYSRHVLPQPDDWNDNHHVTGYWFLDEDNWTPPSDFVEFLDSGPPPVYVGFGSMRTADPESVGNQVIEAINMAGVRGVVASGWGGIEQGNLPDHIYMVSSIPHHWLFPKMSAVVHHGGAGTTAAGLRAGVPSLIVPFMGDQKFWGHQVTKLGVGSQPILIKQLTARRLAQSIDTLLSDKQVQTNASQLGQLIKQEDGVANAVRIIEHFITQQNKAIPVR